MPDTDQQLGVMRSIEACVVDIRDKLDGLLTEIKRGNDNEERNRKTEDKKKDSKIIRESSMYQAGKKEKGKKK